MNLWGSFRFQWKYQNVHEVKTMGMCVVAAMSMEWTWPSKESGCAEVRRATELWLTKFLEPI